MNPPDVAERLTLSLLLLWGAATLGWWGLAFPPVATPPPWLAVVQAVCFGTTAGGLPAPYGWGALIAGPLGMLAVLLVGWGRDLLGVLGRLRRQPLALVALSALGLALLAQAGWVAWRVALQELPPSVFRGTALSGTAPVDPLPEGYPRQSWPAPDFRLVNRDGREVTLADYRGRVLFLSFAFGHCTTVCPVVVRNVAQALGELPPDRVGALVLTLDAWRDTPGALAGIEARWGLPLAVQWLSGRPFEVNAVLDRYQVARRRDENTGEIDHVALVYVIDPQGNIAYALLNPLPGWLVEAARRLGAGPA
ncbi:MAG: SCO family protein [Candidatus Lambdaproteobacteria bacterium]|nr:SCO family protein [Candidatus Lambdaproteobacteria bacterium]